MDLSKVRSSGDGMDNAKLAALDSCSAIKLNYRPSEAIRKSLQPVEAKHPIFSIPKYIPKERRTPKCLIRKPKEPKFVPYEPYKAAIEPIIPNAKIVKKEVVKAKSIKSNNVDIQDLVSQLSEVRNMELNKMNADDSSNDGFISKKQWESEKKSYENDIKNLRETNAHLENQVKFQTKVNSELKTLLVAAVGEDLESRVQHLTEDKLQLARALLKSANHITSHQEQMEWLSGQCEVWRSKFLASSLMVEELARWKSALSTRITDLQEIIKGLIDERSKVRSYSIKTLNYLTHIIKTMSRIDCNIPLKSTNIMELSTVNCSLSENIAYHLINKESTDLANPEEYLTLSKHTPGESAALQILKSPPSLKGKPDHLCNALMGAAVSASGGQMFLQHPSFTATCCAHCKGEVQNL